MTVKTSSELSVGDKAPEFSALDEAGRRHSLKDYRGKTVVLYFYPKDNTSGCTAQACGLRDRIKTIEAAGAVVLGVSPDSPASHEKFTQKFSLPFILLSDPEHKALKAYGVWVKKSMYGRQYMGVERSTFIVGKAGRIEKIFRKVKSAENPGDMADYLSGKTAAAA